MSLMTDTTPRCWALASWTWGWPGFSVWAWPLWSSAADARLTKQARSNVESTVESFMGAPCQLINRLMKIWVIVVLGCAADVGATFRLVGTGFCFALQCRVDHLEAVGQHRL